MTVDNVFEVKKVAIIGGGIAGLTTLFELLNVKKEGTTSLKYSNSGELVSHGTTPSERAFSKIDVFEQSDQIGGIWNPSFDDAETIDQDLLDTGKYDDPNILRPETRIPENLREGIYSFEKPFVTRKRQDTPKPWTRSGIYRSLFSNVPERYLRNSFMPFLNKAEEDPSLAPLIDNGQIINQVEEFAKRFDLLKYVKLNSEVVNITKDNNDNQWTLTIRNSISEESDEWYQERYDAVIVSNGHYSIPYIPYIKGLDAWNKKYPGTILHSKSYRNNEIFENKNVLFIGTGLSGVDLIQYAFPVARNVYVARTPGKREVYEWLGNAATSEGIQTKPRVSSIDPEKNSVTFVDGTTVEGIDTIVLSTGYHWHYPFLSEELTGVKVKPGRNGKNPDSGSSVSGLYLNTFSIQDPTLAFVGVTITSIKWPSFELTASAIAGVWTNKSGLPSKEDQVSSNQERLKDTGTGLEFHYYPYECFKGFASQLEHFLPLGRQLSDIFDEEHLETDFERSFVVAEKLFYEYKSGQLK